MIGNNNQRSTAASSSSSAVNTASSGAAPPPPPGKYVNETLKILGGQDFDVSSTSSSSKKKRRSEHIADLERLLPPLFSQSATHSIPLSTVADDKTEGGDKTTKDVVDKEDATKTETSKNESVDEESSNQRRLKRLKLQLQHCKDLNHHEMKRRRQFVSSFVSLHTMYESGLDFIAKTSSLGNVPDNVMADEIPKSA